MATGITETDVWTAADALLLEGARPTIERIRQKIGRGSPNTVSPYLDTWFKSLGLRIKDPGAFSAPAALPDPIRQAAKHFWETALAAARGELAEEITTARAALETEAEGLESLKLALKARETFLEGQLAAKEQTLGIAQANAVELRERLKQLEDELRERGEQLTLTTNERNELRDNLSETLKRHDVDREAWAMERRELEARHHAAEHRWVEEVDRARQEAKKLEADLARQKTSADGRQAAWNVAREQLEADARRHAREAAESLKIVADEAQRNARELALAVAAKDSLAHRLSQSEAHIERLMADVRSKETERAALLDQLLRRQSDNKSRGRKAAQ